MKYYVSYDEIHQEWCVYQSDGGQENGHFYDVMICSDDCKQAAVFLRDALENFDKTLGDYL